MAEKYRTSRIKGGKKNESARTLRAGYETILGEYVEP
jgi:hypothetical protein